MEGGAVCQASRAQEWIEPLLERAWSREELVGTCVAGPTTCLGGAAGVAYSSGWSLGRLQHPLLLVKHHQAVFKSTAATLVVLLKLQFSFCTIVFFGSHSDVPKPCPLGVLDILHIVDE